MGADAPAGATAQGTSDSVVAEPGEVDTPRQVIRGENPSKEEIKLHAQQPNPAAAFIDWLNFTFPYIWESGKGAMELDQRFRKAFGFGVKENRGRGHLNYEQS